MSKGMIIGGVVMMSPQFSTRQSRINFGSTLIVRMSSEGQNINVSHFIRNDISSHG